MHRDTETEGRRPCEGRNWSGAGPSLGRSSIAGKRQHLVKFMITHRLSPISICLLHWPNRRLEWRCGTYDPCIFTSLVVTPISVIPPGDSIAFALLFS